MNSPARRAGDQTQLLEKLQDPSDNGAVAKLARLVVEDALGRTIGELVDVEFVVGALRDGLRAFTASEAVAAQIVARIGAADKKLAAEKAPLDALLPESIVQGARELAALRVTPSRPTVVKLLDREPLKKLLRAQVVDTLVAFGRRAASPVADNPIARGLGGLGKLALGQAKPGALGALANAVSGEVERQVEKRATDFADTAVAGILDGLADQISDPSRAAEQAAMRLALLDGFLELSGAEVAELGRGPLAERVAVVRKALSAWSASEAFEAEVTKAVRDAVADDAKKTLGELLEEHALKDVVTARAVELVRVRTQAFVAAGPFAAWLGELVAGA